MNKAILDNTTDSVRLYDAVGNLADIFNYNSHDYCLLHPTEGYSNSTSSPTVGVCVDSVPPNKSYARIPDGLGPRIDPIPTPGFANSEIQVDFVISEIVSDAVATTSIESPAVEEVPVQEEVASTTIPVAPTQGGSANIPVVESSSAQNSSASETVTTSVENAETVSGQEEKQTQNADLPPEVSGENIPPQETQTTAPEIPVTEVTISEQVVTTPDPSPVLIESTVETTPTVILRVPEPVIAPIPPEPIIETPPAVE